MAKPTQPDASVVVEMNLRELRIALGKSQVEVANASEVGQPKISEFERRREGHMLNRLRRHIYALGGDVEVYAVFGARRIRLKDV